MNPKSILLLASTASALSFPNVPRSVSDILGLEKIVPRKDASCPSVWSTISSELTTMFYDGTQCTDDARAAIRLNFHDCGAWETKLGATGGCDGSLILAGELSRGENKGLDDIAAKIKNLASKYKVGVAGNCAPSAQSSES